MDCSQISIHSFIGELNKTSLVTFPCRQPDGDVILLTTLMENLKKKRSELRGDHRLPGKKTKFKKERSDVGGTADDAELEEFFAILQRLQTGFDYFQNKGVGGCGGKSAAAPPATGSGLCGPAFQLEDFKPIDDGSRPIASSGGALQKDNFVGFDLNADPETQLKSI
ncbi:unnamed protein product [Lactuca virosa]|uniref:Uncharacterized protein n=1 Tax=Lactuca virosa TaxID=75947 RepID=A0AAU9LU77_9ASTR|nr:unnamed protein product [Lactuca virosa]